MEIAEIKSIEDVVKDSGEIQVDKEKLREFDYKINEKSLRTKLLKGAQRIPFDIVRNNGSINLEFNIGAWRHIVLPSIWYWDSNQVGKTCKIGEYEVKIASVKSGSEATGMHVDTQITFFINGEKAVCHCYNTTQRIMVNAQGHVNFVEKFLAPYFKSKIDLDISQIAEYNDKVLNTLVEEKRTQNNSSHTKNAGSTVTYSCKQCDFVSNTVTSLAKHSKTEHAIKDKSNSSETRALIHKPSTSYDVLLIEDDVQTLSTTLNEKVCSTDKESRSNQRMNHCEDCNISFAEKVNLEIHMVMYHKSDQKRHECEDCNEVFASALELEWHLETEHENITNERAYSEGYLRVDSNNDVDKEKERLESLLNEKEEIIKVQAKEISKLKRQHEKVEKEFEGKLKEQKEELQKSFISLDKHVAENIALKEELEVVRKLKEVSKNIENVSINTSENNVESEVAVIEEDVVVVESVQYDCIFCDEKFISENLLQTHLQDHHKITRNTECQAKIKCSKCDFTTNSKEQLDDHIKLKHSKIDRVCYYWRQNKCNKKENCQYRHSNAPKCRNKTDCKFLPNCKFHHEDIPVCKLNVNCKNSQCKLQHPTRRTCKFQEKCRNENCSFVHFGGTKNPNPDIFLGSQSWPLPQRGGWSRRK